MKSSLAKKASITLPPDLEKELQNVARKEQRTLSSVLQEAARYYLSIRRWDKLQKSISLKRAAMGIQSEEDIDNLIHKMRAKH